MHPEPVLKSNDIETGAPARVGDILGYARVSTHDQHPDAQRDRLMEAGALRVFTDIISGKRFDRPALAELIDHARPGDRLCIIRLDRLGRSLRELLETVDDLKARGIHLLSLEERLDTSSAAGELVFHVFGAIAHFERRLISERTRDGIAAARKRGRTPGRPPLTSVPHFQDHASDNWEPEGAGSDGVVNRSWSGRRSNMLSWSTCSIW